MYLALTICWQHIRYRTGYPLSSCCRIFDSIVYKIRLLGITCDKFTGLLKNHSILCFGSLKYLRVGICKNIKEGLHYWLLKFICHFYKCERLLWTFFNWYHEGHSAQLPSIIITNCVTRKFLELRKLRNCTWQILFVYRS